MCARARLPGECPVLGQPGASIGLREFQRVQPHNGPGADPGTKRFDLFRAQSGLCSLHEIPILTVVIDLGIAEAKVAIRAGEGGFQITGNGNR